MTRLTRAELAGRAPAGGRSRLAAANRPAGPRRDDERVAARRDERRARSRTTDDQPLAASWDPQPDPASRRPDAGGRRIRRGGTGRGNAGLLARVVATYGWRVYALPVLVVLTVLAVWDVAGSLERPAPSDSVRGGAAAGGPLIPNPIGGLDFQPVKESAELPGGGPFTLQGAETWRVVPGAGAPFGSGQLVTYTIEIEDGVELEGGAEGFATTVDSTLNNPKSWIGSGRYQFQRIDDSPAADLRISLTSQLTTRAVCGYRIPFDASCWKGDEGRVVINNARWARGAVAFEGNVVQYQQYVVNHEVGHGLGFSHIPCEASGQLAPVMMQQTWAVSNDYLAALGTDQVSADGKVCQPNAWPFPMVS